MKDVIVEYLRNNTNSDGINVASWLKIRVDESYKLLRELENDGIIKREYYGIKARYIVLN